MRLFQSQNIYSIVRVFFAITLLQFVAVNVEAKTFDVESLWGLSYQNNYYDTDLNHTELINKFAFQLSTYSLMHTSLDKQNVINLREQLHPQNEVIACEFSGFDVDKCFIDNDLCDECKCHGGHIIFTSTFKFVAFHFFSVPVNTQNPQYLPPAILLLEKPPIA
ncbi:hypothetical protein [uncultured Shewanella sp.]|uniref:hypothetical protein n=1 Tax=uncultured Shewanella sp. TaxID=173975 RepID=UPI00261E8286|nr:hypothetical protein [uncultured Shewanella sp.]